MNAKVSVILPSLNVANYIRECLNSVINQTLYELEIICVDACSTDGTEEILREYAKRDERIVILHSEIKSYGKQVNMGLEFAGGEYIAVLETDDWIVPDMYQCLYEYAVADKLDYVAADFDVFYELQNGCNYYSRRALFPPNKQDWYGKILYSEQIATLRASDYVLWRGIYDRKFLNGNHIRMHESAGAAFQDMGFLQQVKTFAEKAKYINESFYRYRQGREAASSVSLEGLRYYAGEFDWLNGREAFYSNLKGIHKKYYYFTMSISFITKYEQVLECLEGNWQDIRLAEPYKWFRKQMVAAINKRLIEETMYKKEVWERFMILLASPRTHAVQAVRKKIEKEEIMKLLLHLTKRRPVAIFGCGNRGERLMHFCNSNNIPIASFCDNNAALHGERKLGIRIISPKELKDELYNKNEVVILSMKEGKEQVKEQLLNLGIEIDRIIDEIPEGIL